MNLSSNALQLVNKHINTVYTHGSLMEQGLASLLKAQCLLAEAKTSQLDVEANSEEANKRSQLLPLLGQAEKMFNKIEAFYHVKDVVYLETLLYHHLGYEKERNTQALKFRQLEEQYPAKSSSQTNGMMIFMSL